jgi:hypothetical protein
MVDLSSLKEQYKDRKYGELIMHLYKKQDLETTLSALMGTVEELPPNSQGLFKVQAWIDQFTVYGVEAEFWQRGCGEVFSEICSEARLKLSNQNSTVTDEDVFNMFQIINLTFVYAVHKDSELKALIRKSTGIDSL